MKRLLALGCFLIITFVSNAQSADHWETIVFDSTTWKYFPGTSNPPDEWKTISFDDNSWSFAKGGFGFGDNDDYTTVEGVMSIYIRKKFNIIDKNAILDAILHVDYDDGFVAYLNGVEIARANINQLVPAYNDQSSGLHEAVMYQGIPPEAFTIDDAHLNLLVSGENVLCLQVHNSDPGSSDLTIRPFLSIGVADETRNYFATPDWFIEPLNFQSSDLPIIVIDTHGLPISDEPGIIAEMGIIDNGAGVRNHMIDPFNNFHGNIGIEFRGESSQMFPKKSLKVETVTSEGPDSTVSLLGMPPEDDWILYATYTDKTLMRNALTYALANRLGHYASRTRYCELVINGDYQGIYILMEKIKQDDNRVDIANLKSDEVTGDDITGGYILKVDKIDPNDYPSWTATPAPGLPNEDDIRFQFVDPDGEDMPSAQTLYIKDFIFDFQSALTSSPYPYGSPSHKQFIDLPSFVDFMIINELGKNVDAYKFSTYMHKDKDSNGGKLKMGPIWDFDLAYGNVDYNVDAQFAPGWMYNGEGRMFWFKRLLQDPDFLSQFTCRWIELRQSVLTTNFIFNWMDSTANTLVEARERNYQKWPILGQYVWPNQFVGNTYEEEIDFMKDWIETRLEWMDANIADQCTPVTGIDDGRESLSVEAYPNPFSSAVLFKFNREIKKISIYNAAGELVYISGVGQKKFQWTGQMNDGSELPPGLYIYQALAGNRCVTGKVIKK